MKFGSFVSNWLALITAKFHHVRSYDASNIREYILVSLFNEHGVYILIYIYMYNTSRDSHAVGDYNAKLTFNTLLVAHMPSEIVMLNFKFNTVPVAHMASEIVMLNW
jgi:hypothetical protein